MIRLERMKGLARKPILALALAGTMVGAASGADTIITINGYGGVTWDAIDKLIHAPYTADTGVKVVNTTQPNLAQLQAMVESGDMIYEALELNGQEYVTARNKGWIEEIDYSLADPEKKQPDAARLSHGMVFSTFGTIFGYRTDVFPEGKGPKSWADFWNVEAFPGPRTLQDAVIPNLEIALIADGVPLGEVYKVLETDEGINRAFAKLDQIKPHVVKWWKAGAESVQLLADGEVVMAQSWNGRLFELAKTRPVKSVWDGGVLDYAILSIPKGNPLAKQTMEYFTAWHHPERIAAFAEVTPYPNLLPGVDKFLPAELASELPGTHASEMLLSDVDFWETRREALAERWTAWLLE